MSVNSSSSPDLFTGCFNTTAEVVSISVFLVTRFLLVLPASILVLHLGLRRWRRSVATSSHSDVFTYTSAALELVYVFGAVLDLCGYFAGKVQVMALGYYLCSAVLPGQTSLHILTCVDRYLAVVHPVTYLGLKRSEGVRVRVVSIGCVWLLCIAWAGVTALYSPYTPYVPFFCMLLLFLVVVSFCSISVLCSLIRPGPGETGGRRERVDQSKQRAFSTMAAITAVLWLYFLGFMLCVALDHSLTDHAGQMSCVLLISGYWFALPSSLVLPLLFLHRRVKVVSLC